MTPQTVLKFQDFISSDNGNLTTDSRKVAVVHGRRHDNVLRLITKRIAEAGGWGLLNFKETSYFDEQGRLQPMFNMTKDGYAFLVGKMTGGKAPADQPSGESMQ
jgi:Rha family phage regulatory protein